MPGSSESLCTLENTTFNKEKQKQLPSAPLQDPQINRLVFEGAMALQLPGCDDPLAPIPQIESLP